LKIVLFILSLVSALSCKAQTAELFHYDTYLPEGTYYKDLNNDLDKFVGTWKYQQGNTVLTIVLQKKTHVLNTLNKYYDLIIGEYKYEVDGQIVLNYLPRLQDVNVIGNDHYISGHAILAKNDIPKCEECNLLERRLEVYFTDPEREYLPNAMILRHQIINGVEQLTAELGGASSYSVDEENLPLEPRVPYGTYILIKQ
jgi:hypothetical protein